MEDKTNPENKKEAATLLLEAWAKSARFFPAETAGTLGPEIRKLCEKALHE